MWQSVPIMKWRADMAGGRPRARERRPYARMSGAERASRLFLGVWGNGKIKVRML